MLSWLLLSPDDDDDDEFPILIVLVSFVAVLIREELYVWVFARKKLWDSLRAEIIGKK